MDDDGVERLTQKRQVIDIAMAYAAMFEAGAVEPRARQRQHVARQIKPDAALNLGREQFEHSSGAGAEIQQRADRLVGERGVNLLFDGSVCDVQVADAVPLGGVTAKIILRRRGARAAHRGKPFAVARDDRVARVKVRDQAVGNIRGAAVLAEPKECPRAFAEALDQAGFGEETQMPRKPRLGLPKDFGEVGDGQFGFREQRQNTQPRGFTGGFERARQSLK